MSGASFILAINLSLAGLFAVSFLAIGAYDRKLVAARWIALGYLFGMLNFAAEFAVPFMESALAGVFVAYLAFTAALISVNVGLARKYRVAVPWPAMGIVFAAAAAGILAIYGMPRDSLLRMALYQAPYFVLQAIGAAIVMRAAEKRVADYALAGLLAASSLHFAAKPAMAVLLGGMGSAPQTYLATDYALVSQTLGTVFAVALALMLLVMLVRDLLSDITVKSETDTLSGLLNRGAFEERAKAAIARFERARMPVALVIADLDHFKAINDTLGHQVGDRVIAAFAGRLSEAAGPHHVVGRIGGEEFAVILPDATGAVARLFAENVRVAFSNTSVEGIPAERTLTASFGVTDLAAGDTLSELLRRADGALYAAKSAGRDRVRVAPALVRDGAAAPESLPPRRRMR